VRGRGTFEGPLTPTLSAEVGYIRLRPIIITELGYTRVRLPQERGEGAIESAGLLCGLGAYGAPALGLLRFDAQCADQLAPFCGFVSDELAKLAGRIRKCGGSQLSQTRHDAGIRKARIDAPVQRLDDLG